IVGQQNQCDQRTDDPGQHTSLLLPRKQGERQNVACPLRQSQAHRQGEQGGKEGIGCWVLGVGTAFFPLFRRGDGEREADQQGEGAFSPPQNENDRRGAEGDSPGEEQAEDLAGGGGSVGTGQEAGQESR